MGPGMDHDVSMSPPVRILLTLVALLASAWFGLGWVQARDTSRAQALLASVSTPSHHQATEIRSLLHSAGQLNPDRTVSLLRASLAEAQGHLPTALRLIKQVTRAEPNNVFAWDQLGFAAGAAKQVGLAKRAGAQVGRLAPPVR